MERKSGMNRPRLSTIARKMFGADAWVVGYPKCGNTWFQVMLRKALVMTHGLPDTAVSRVLTNWQPARALKRVPIGITHHMPLFNSESYRTMAVDVSLFRGRKVVLLVRDPRDTLVSLYMHNVYGSGPRPAYSGDVDSMVHSEIYGVEKFIKYYRSWYEERSIPRTLMLVRYEDLSSRTAEVLAAALQFLEVPRVNDALVRDVIAFASFENMRRLESTNGLRWYNLNSPPGRPQEGFRTRKGLVGGYRNYLSTETIDHITRRMNADLPAYYGYSDAATVPVPPATTLAERNAVRSPRES
jgi:hypothetical protein